jgi:hypothetical protein
MMPENFTVFNARNRDANVQYNSGSYVVPVDSTYRMVRFALNTLDLANEPDTTVFHWLMQRNDGGGWVTMLSGTMQGHGGEPSHLPGNTIATSIDGIRGQEVRGVVYHVAANDARKRYGVSGQTY